MINLQIFVKYLQIFVNVKIFVKSIEKWDPHLEIDVQLDSVDFDIVEASMRNLKARCIENSDSETLFLPLGFLKLPEN